MSLSNEQLLLLDTLTYYPQLSDKKLYERKSNDDNIKISEIIDNVKNTKSNSVFTTIISINTGFEALFQMDRYGIMEGIRLNMRNEILFICLAKR